jgi:hypothetical protein
MGPYLTWIQGGTASRDTWINCLGSYHVSGIFCDVASILDHITSNGGVIEEQ